MLRLMTPLLIALFAAGTAAAQDGPAAIKPADAPAAAKPADAPATPAATNKADDNAVKSAASAPISKDPGRRPATRRPAIKAAGQLPSGLPRAHYSYRTTVAPPTPPRYVRRGRILVVEEPEPLFTRIGVIPFARGVNGTPLLPGSSTLPGYYGTDHSYSYDGPYYGGPYESYWNRLPYACGVYGYC